ncbi:MAG: P-II family nitrogen regulator [Methanobrevibacter sp.]|jgi:nitrogen regulatory protein P-II 1|nr:P-II family nitrogen regulator [Candidatus Methanovirga meridionalis]
MKKIVAIVRDSRFEAIKKALVDLGCGGMTVWEVKGRGKQLGIKESYRGFEYCVDLLPKIRIEIVVKAEQVDNVIKAIVENGQTDSIGDGKIFVSNIEKVVRIRTEEFNDDAI